MPDLTNTARQIILNEGYDPQHIMEGNETNHFQLSLDASREAFHSSGYTVHPKHNTKESHEWAAKKHSDAATAAAKAVVAETHPQSKELLNHKLKLHSEMQLHHLEMAKTAPSQKTK